MLAEVNWYRLYLLCSLAIIFVGSSAYHTYMPACRCAVIPCIRGSVVLCCRRTADMGLCDHFVARHSAMCTGRRGSTPTSCCTISSQQSVRRSWGLIGRQVASLLCWG
jgi:hypothetical protein